MCMPSASHGRCVMSEARRTAAAIASVGLGPFSAPAPPPPTRNARLRNYARSSEPAPASPGGANLPRSTILINQLSRAPPGTTKKNTSPSSRLALHARTCTALAFRRRAVHGSRYTARSPVYADLAEGLRAATPGPLDMPEDDAPEGTQAFLGGFPTAGLARVAAPWRCLEETAACGAAWEASPAHKELHQR